MIFVLFRYLYLKLRVYTGLTVEDLHIVNADDDDEKNIY